ncbi:MAG: YbjN domain-containing protein [Pseudomonadota bacterium]
MKEGTPMSIELIHKHETSEDPLTMLEAAAETLEFEMERVGECELHVMLPGVWRDLGVWFTWRPELATLQMGAPIDLKAPATRLEEASRLVTMVNERLWIGHFDLWTDDNAIVYRNATILPDGGALMASQAEALIRAASEAVDRFYPAFNFLVWGGKSPSDALEASLFETAGSA